VKGSMPVSWALCGAGADVPLTRRGWLCGAYATSSDKFVTDHQSSTQRSRNMARIRSKDTCPELRVRRLLHELGCRFRLHRADLPGTPDIVLPRYRAVIFVHGCFWHRHPGCRRSFSPATRSEFWERKLARNVERDAESRRRLGQMGWQVTVIWECETKDRDALLARLQDLVFRRFAPEPQPWPLVAEESAGYGATADPAGPPETSDPH
jgi:DNA mismatch endonuclease, patch repair protein